MTITFRLAQLSDAEACNAFQAKWLKHPRTTSQWIWEFAPDAGARPILYALALDGEEIVGSQALIRVPMRGPWGIAPTAKGEDTLIHPRFWGKDILSPLWDLLFEAAAREGIRFAWGFNSRRPVFQKLGFRYLDSDSAMSLLRPLSAAGLQRLALFDAHGKRKPARHASWRHKVAASGIAGALVTVAAHAHASLGGLKRDLFHRGHTVIREALPANDELDGFLDDFVRHTDAVTVDRSAAFLRWRLLDNPWAPSRLITAWDGGDLVGIAAFALSAQGTGTVSDLIACDRRGRASENASIIFDLLRRATAELAKSGADIVSMPIMNMHAAAAGTITVAKTLGFFSKPNRVGACVRPIGRDDLGYAVLDHRKWHFTHLNTEGRDG